MRGRMVLTQDPKSAAAAAAAGPVEGDTDGAGDA